MDDRRHEDDKQGNQWLQVSMIGCFVDYRADTYTRIRVVSDPGPGGASNTPPGPVDWQGLAARSPWPRKLSHQRLPALNEHESRDTKYISASQRGKRSFITRAFIREGDTYKSER